MRYLKVIMWLAFFLCVQQVGYAATNIQFLSGELTVPQYYNQDIKITLYPDEALCKGKYKDSWSTLCSGYVGQVGQYINDISINPPVKGQWRWSEANTLSFMPATQTMWEPDTTYTITLGSEFLPSFVSMNMEYSFTTLPRAARFIENSLWVDPSQNKKHVFSTTLKFIYPVEDKKQIEENLIIAPENKKSGMQIGKAEYQWSKNNTLLSVNVPILKMPKKYSLLNISLGILPAYEEDYYENYIIDPNKTFATFNVTGENKLFYIKDISLVEQFGKELEKEFVLNLETSLHIASSDLEKSIKAFALPKKNSEEARIPYAWDLAPTVSDEDLTNPVKLVPLDKDNIPKNTHSFKVEVNPETYVLIQTDEGMKSTSGIATSSKEQYTVYAGKWQPHIGFLQNGFILNLEGSKNIAIQTNQLTELNWKAKQVKMPYMNIFAKSFHGFDNSYSDYEAISEVVSGSIPVDGMGKEEAQLINLNISNLLEDKNPQTTGLILLNLTGMQGDESVAYAQRLILITDIGLIVKENNRGTQQVFAYSLSKGDPLADIKLELLGLNGNILASAISNNEGMAELQLKENFVGEKATVALIATSTQNSDFAFMGLSEDSYYGDNEYEYQGRSSIGTDMTVYAFSERGVFRPGEMLHFGALLRQDNGNMLSTEIPLKAVLYDPSGVIVLEKTLEFSLENFGLQSISWQSQSYSLTGRYRLDIQMPASKGSNKGSVLGSANVRVEEFQSETMTIDTNFTPEKPKGWLYIDKDTKLESEIILKNLYGLPATERKIEATYDLSSSSIYFNEPNAYSDYYFSDQKGSSGFSASYPLAEGITDTEGKVKYNLDLKEALKGTMHLVLYAEGFEPNGGRAVSTQTSIIVSPSKYIVGYKPVGEVLDLNYIPLDRKGSLEFVSLDSNLELYENQTFNFVLSERVYVTNLVSNTNSQYYYENTPVEKEISKEKINTSKGTCLWEIPTDKAGEFLLTVYNEENVQVARVPFNVIGNEIKQEKWNVSSILLLSSNKAKYNAGEEAELTLTVPYDGFGLVTLETDKVLSFAWFKGKIGQNKVSIDIPEDIEGRAYFSVSYMRSIESTDIYLGPLTTEVQPVEINIEKSNLNLTLEAPEKVYPNTTAKITVKAKEAGKAHLFAVDEGILALTSFNTPSPTRFFLEDRALGIETLSMADFVMPEMRSAMLMQGVNLASSAFGGDMALKAANFQNPFKRKAEPPLSFWSSLISVGPEGTEVEIPIPHYYNGNVRIMVVGASENAFGSAEAQMLVRHDLVLTPQIPVKVIPDDVIEGALALANSTDKEQEIMLSVNTSQALEILSPLPEKILLQAYEEKVLPVDFKVLPILGEGSITFYARTGEHSIERKSTLSVRPATPYVTSIEIGTLTQPTLIPVKRNMYDYDIANTFAASYLPTPLIEALMQYLKTYPFECTEQLISRALPYVALSKYPELLYGSSVDPKEAEEKGKNLINQAIYAIRGSLSYDGPLRIWQSGSETSTLLTVYAADFFLAMREAGLIPPRDVEDKVFRAVSQIAGSSPQDIEEARIIAYAIWVLTREGTVTTQYIESLMATLAEASPNSNLSTWERDILKPLLASSYVLLRLESHATALMKNYEPDFLVQKYVAPFDALAANALYLRVMATSFPKNLSAEELNTTTQEAISAFRYNYSTFSSAQTIKALASVPQLADENKNLRNIQVECLNAAFAPLNIAGVAISSPLCTEYTVNIPESDSPLYYQITTSGFDKDVPTSPLAEGVQIKKVLLNSNNEVVTSGEIGEILTIELTANSIEFPQENIVITDLFSGAFEPLFDQNHAAPLSYGNRVELREDRALFFISLTPEESVYRYQVRVTSKGDFVLPAAYIQSMYDKKIQGHSVASEFKVQ